MRAIDERKTLGITRGLMRDQHSQFFERFFINFLLKPGFSESEVNEDGDDKDAECSPNAETFPLAMLIQDNDYLCWRQTRPSLFQLNHSYLFVLHFIIIIKAQQQQKRSYVTTQINYSCFFVQADQLNPNPRTFLTLYDNSRVNSKICGLLLRYLLQSNQRSGQSCDNHMQKCFDRAKEAFACSSCQLTCHKKNTLRCKWRKPLTGLYNACQVEMQKVGMIGPELTEKIGRLKAVQERMGQLKERKERVLERLAISGDFIEPTPTQYQSTHQNLSEEIQSQSFTFGLAHPKTVTSAYKQQTDQRYDEILSISARLQAQAKELSESLEQIKQTNKELVNDNNRYDNYFSTKVELQYPPYDLY